MKTRPPRFLSCYVLGNYLGSRTLWYFSEDRIPRDDNAAPENVSGWNIFGSALLRLSGLRPLARAFSAARKFDEGQITGSIELSPTAASASPGSLSKLLPAKGWTDLIRPTLFLSWLPAEHAFIRAVQLPSADAAELPHALLKKTASRIINEVKGINRVTYDVTSKPPGTIEWE